MDLDTDSIRSIKDIMVRMGISPHDCFERADLKKKLVENVPELRREMERRESLASHSSSEGIFAMGSSRNSRTHTRSSHSHILPPQHIHSRHRHKLRYEQL